MKNFLPFAVAVFFITGCASYSSTIMSRLPNDRLRKNNNQCVKGIPVTVKIPTHVDAIVKEEYFVVQGRDQSADGSTGSGNTVTHIPNLGKPIRSVSLETIYTPKVLTTNFVRPAAGTLLLGDDSKDGITLDPENYFATIQGKVDDQTLEDLNAAIPNIKKVIGLQDPVAKKVSAGGKATSLERCESFSSVVAYRRFDINEPGWEMELQTFVDSHISCQTQPCGIRECYETEMNGE